MNKEEFKNYVNEIAKNELRNSFDNNLMETLNSAFIFKYVETLEKENKELKDNWNKLRETLKNEQLGSILYSDRTRFADIDEILLKMQELEKSDSNE